MAGIQKNVEDRLVEFTEVHGTVLLGMHRELKSQQQKVEDKLSTALADLHGATAQFRQELWEKSTEIKSYDQLLKDQLGGIDAEAERRASAFRAEIEKHLYQVESTAQKLRSDVELFRNRISGLLRTIRDDADGLVANAKREATYHLKQTAKNFDAAFAEYDQRLQASETKVLNYMIAQQRLLDGQTRELRALYVRSRKLLVGTAFAVLIAFVFGAWRIWAS
jgi:hypothetical protein